MLIDTASPRSRESVCPLHAVGAVCWRSGTDRILLVSGWCPAVRWGSWYLVLRLSAV